MNLCQRGHDFELPMVKFDYSKQGFIVNSLLKYHYLSCFVWLF
jgi:hypothetical protein